jgi:myo-inositol-1(or 4)-monophosphatase
VSTAVSEPGPSATGAKVAAIVAAVMAESRPLLPQAALSGRSGEQENPRHSDNFLSGHDLRMHRRYRDLFAQALGSFVYASEEDDPAVVGPDLDPDLVVLVDPLDTSELAVRALHGYTHVMLYSRSLARPVAAVIGDIYHHLQMYVACRQDDGTDQAFLLTADGQACPLRTRTPVPLNRALVTNYLMRPADRLVPLAGQHRLIAALTAPDPDGTPARGRIGVDFGSVSLCHVATGQTDATIEFQKGFAIWDLAPGHYVLHAAGGTVIDLHGNTLPLDYQLDTLGGINTAMDGRRMFIAASGPALADQILAALDA